jgi:hypothetical protein
MAQGSDAIKEQQDQLNAALLIVLVHRLGGRVVVAGREFEEVMRVGNQFKVEPGPGDSLILSIVRQDPPLPTS